MNRNQMQDTGAAYLDLLTRMEALPQVIEELKTDQEMEDALKALRPIRAALRHKIPGQSVTVYASPGGATVTPVTTTYHVPGGSVTRVIRPFLPPTHRPAFLAGQVGGQRARKGIIHPGEPGAAEAEAQWKAQRARKGIGARGFNGWIFSGTVD